MYRLEQVENDDVLLLPTNDANHGDILPSKQPAVEEEEHTPAIDVLNTEFQSRYLENESIINTIFTSILVKHHLHYQILVGKCCLFID